MKRAGKNGAHVEAVEIIRQASQGYSVKPFIIRASDEQTYFVKGVQRAGKSSLVSEALAAELGRSLGLPVPDWRVMTIPDELIAFSTLSNVDDLRGGLAFASLQVANSSDLLISSVDSIPADLQLMVYVFDWWIQNGDRTLSEFGGNVNLLIDSKGELAVIDHNAAFDANFTVDELREHHVFRDQAVQLRDMIVRLDCQRNLERALRKWVRITAVLPEAWLFQDDHHIDHTNPTLDQRLGTLRRIRDARLWGEL